MSSAQTLNAFLKQYLEDQCSARTRTLDDYVRMFPGQDSAIGEMHARLESEAEPPPPRASDAMRRIGPYRIVSELGRGGQGVVYFAEDERLPRKVALKVLTGLGSLAPNRVARFLREAEVASKLDHPGIATVYEIGTEGGVPYLAMRFVDGETLAARIGRGTGSSEKSDSVRSSARIAEKAARALHAAHELGIIHRDVKPCNILIQADGDPVIVDFGLAHDADSDLAGLTKTGEFFGTPAYMSPEQIATQSSRPDRRTDVWSLGATLYECLTGARPFEAPTREQLYRAVLQQEPRDPRRLNAAIPEDLAAIVEMALQKEVDRRYETAAAMADDLAAFAAGRPVAARRIGPVARFHRWSRREPAKAALFVLALVAFPTIAVLLTSYLGNRPKVEAARLRALEERKDDLISQAVYDLGEGSPDRALSGFERAAAIEGGSPEAVIGVAAVLLNRRKFSDALAILDREDALVHGLRVAVMFRAQALTGLGHEAEAAALEKLAPAAASAPDFYLDGLRLLEQGHSGREAAFREAVSQFRSAICEAPAPRALYFEALAHAAKHARDASAAREVARAIRNHWPRSSRGLFWAGTALDLVSPTEAIGFLREAIAIDPNYGEAWCNLGYSQLHAGLVDDAISSCREAIRLDPLLIEAHNTLASSFLTKGDFEGAVASCREAIRTRPQFARAHAVLGGALLAKRSFDDAIAECREAIRLDPTGLMGHLFLANALREKGALDEAIAVYWKAIGIDCFNADVHFGLAVALRAKGLVTESIASYREAIRLRPTFAEAHCNLGSMLSRDGQLVAALEEARRGHELGSRQPRWSYPSAEWIADAEERILKERHMLAVASGEKSGETATELLGLADIAALTKRWRLAVGWFEAAFEADPGLKETSEQWPFKAARAAVQTALANDGESRPSADSARLRALGLGWLQAELRYERDLVDAGAWDSERLRRSVSNWLCDPALASVRDPTRIALFAPEEARAWAAFWAGLR